MLYAVGGRGVTAPCLVPGEDGLYLFRFLVCVDGLCLFRILVCVGGLRFFAFYFALAGGSRRFSRLCFADRGRLVFIPLFGLRWRLAVFRSLLCVGKGGQGIFSSVLRG